MAPALIAALVAGGTSLLGTITNNIIQNRAIKKQNEYNSPESQMQRFQSAGLSPNLIYGNGSASAGNQTSLGDYQGVKVSTQDAVNMANAILQFRNTDANTRKANAEAQSVELDNQMKGNELIFYNDRLNLENQLKWLDVQYKTGNLTTQQYQQRIQLAQLDNILANTALTKFNKDTYYPTLLSIQRQNANTSAGQLTLARERFGWEKDPWNPEYLAKQNANKLFDYTWQWRDSDRFLNFLTSLIPFTGKAYR